MRQGVPLLISDSPYIGTGMEAKVAQDSRAVCRVGGCRDRLPQLLQRVDGGDEGRQAAGLRDREFLSQPLFGQVDNASKGSTSIRLRKFMRSNAGTCMNQKPLVRRGEKVKEGDVLADGPNTAAMGNWRWAGISWWPSCHGTATTLRTPLPFPREW